MAKRYSDAPLITDENLLKLKRTREEREIFWLYCGFSVGKSRDQAQRALGKLLDAGKGRTPFARIRSLIRAGTLRKELEKTRIGGWTRLEGFLRETIEKNPDLDGGTVDELQQVHGIAAAKSRFFILYTRANARHAVLDRHILSHLRDQGHDVPDTAPASRRQYARIEALWLQELANSGMTPQQYNLKRWRERARGGRQ